MNETWSPHKRISVVVDCPGWFDVHAERLVELLVKKGHDADLVRDHGGIQSGDIAFYLACMKITPPEILALNRWNLVVHESNLPTGRGFAPLTWSILEGRNEVDACLIVAADGPVDSGPIVMRRTMHFTGYELNAEIRSIQAETTIALCLDFVSADEPPQSEPQTGEASFYPRRRPKDSLLDSSASLLDQFNLLRVVDNERYPAFFYVGEKKYILKIYHGDN